MDRKAILFAVLVIVIVVGALGLAAYSYNMGVVQGLAQSDKSPATGNGTLPYYPFAGGPFFYRPWGFGFGLLGCLVPLFFFFLIFGMLRMVFWGPRWGRGWRHMAEGGVPPMFEQWHQKAHENNPRSG